MFKLLKAKRMKNKELIQRKYKKNKGKRNPHSIKKKKKVLQQKTQEKHELTKLYQDKFLET